MALNNFIGKRKWRAQFEAGREAVEAGDFVTAEASLKNALEHAATVGERDASVGDTALLLGQVYARTARFPEAMVMSQRAFDHYEAQFGLVDPRTIQAHLAVVLADPSRAHSDTNVRKATYELARSQFGKRSWQVVRTAALALSAFSSHEKELLYDEVYSACSGILNAERTELMEWPPVAAEFASALMETPDTMLATRFLASQVRVHEEQFGADSEETALIRGRLGELFLDQDRPAEAESIFAEALDKIKVKFGLKSELAKRAMVGLGRALSRQGKLEKAFPYLTEALQFLEPHQASERMDILVSLLEYKCLIGGSDAERGALWRELESLWDKNQDELIRSKALTGLLNSQKRLQQAWELGAAERLLQVVLVRVREWRGPHHRDVAHVLMELASCASAVGDKEQGLRYLEQSLALDEGIENLIRSVTNYGCLGEWDEAKQRAYLVLRLLKDLPAGLARERLRADFACSLLYCGEFDLAIRTADQTLSILPPGEQFPLLHLLGQIKVVQGSWPEAVGLLTQALEKVTDPYKRALVSVHLAWLYSQSSRFEDAHSVLDGVGPLVALRPDHPVRYLAQAVSARLAFYSGKAARGAELRQEILSFLAIDHRNKSRALGILALLGPFGPENSELELEVGQEILTASGFPDGSVYAYPYKDIASTGLRHLARGYGFQGDTERALAYLVQYRERFFAHHNLDNPRACTVYLTTAQLKLGAEERCDALELALRDLRRLADQHIALFPTLNLLTKLYIEIGDVDKALAACRLAVELRKTPKLSDWLSILERGELPQIDPSILAREASIEGGESELETEPETPESLAEEPAEPTEPPVTEVIIAAGVAEPSQLAVAQTLIERDTPPTSDEVDALLTEVKAHYGEEPRAEMEAKVMLALLSEGEQATTLWVEVLSGLDNADLAGFARLEQRAREASRFELVVLTLEKILAVETERYGVNAVEAIATQLRMARALETIGRPKDAFQRLLLVVEVLRSWFGTRSVRLLEPLNDLIRVSAELDGPGAALEFQQERHRILENSGAMSTEIFASRVSMFLARAMAGERDDLLLEIQACEAELMDSSPEVAADFSKQVIDTALYIDRIDWRCDLAMTLCELGLRRAPETETALICHAQIASAEMLYRKDYLAQAVRLRDEAIKLSSRLEPENRIEVLYHAAESCIRLHDLEAARKLIEGIIEERIAAVGRRDVWVGRALLLLAEVDLKSYRFEGTETDIDMSAMSLKETPYWSRAQVLKARSLFFLGRYDEAYEVLESLDPESALALELELATWRGRVPTLVERLKVDGDDLVRRRWQSLEVLAMDDAVRLLEFFAQAGQVALLTEGMERIKERARAIPVTDARQARVKLLEARLQCWKADWSSAVVLLQQTLELIPSETLHFPSGLLANEVRSLLITALIESGGVKPASKRAEEGLSESAELLGEEDIRVIHFRTHLARCNRALGRTEEALVTLDELLSPLQDHLGETHPLLREVFAALSLAFLDQDDRESARLSAEEALRIDKECRGLSIQLLEDLELLALIESSEDRDEAINLLDTALEFSEDLLPVGHAYAEVLSNKRQELIDLETQTDLETDTPIGAEVDTSEARADEGIMVDPAESLFDMGPVGEVSNEVAETHEAAQAEPTDTDPVESSSSVGDLIDVDSSEIILTAEEPEPVAEEAELVAEEPEPSEEAELVAGTTEPESSEEPELVEEEPESSEEFESSEEAEPESFEDPESSEEAESVAEVHEQRAQKHSLYRLSSTDQPTVFRPTSASVEFEPDFPAVPFRLPHITEPEPEVVVEEASPEENDEQEPVVVDEVSEEQATLIEQFLSHSDPEAYLLPLAPVFFLPAIWKETTEGAYDERFHDIHDRFQEAYAGGGEWRQIIEEAISMVRREPNHQSGYFLFLLGAQLERAGHLHTADVCLTTATELLDNGPAYGAACHLAGRVAGRRGELGRAVPYFERAAELASEAELAVLKVDAAECQLGLGRPEEALLGLEEVFDYFEESAPRVQVLALQAKMAQVHLLIGDPDTSLVLAEETHDALSPKNAGTYRVLGRILLSRAFARLGRHALALELAERAWEGARRWSEKRREGRRIAISNLVDLYCLNGSFEKAMELCLQSGLTGWGLAEAELLLRAGHLSCELGNIDNAHRYLRLGNAFLSRFRSPALWQSCFLELEADIYIREQEYSKAAAVCERALVLFDREATGPVDRSRHIVRAARVAAGLGETARAVHLIEQAHSLRDLHLGADHPHTSSVEGMSAILS